MTHRKQTITKTPTTTTTTSTTPTRQHEIPAAYAVVPSFTPGRTNKAQAAASADAHAQ